MSKLKTFPSLRKGKQKRKPDPYYPAAVQHAKEAARRLQEAGIVDADGRRIRKDLPLDMREGQDRDLAAEAISQSIFVSDSTFGGPPTSGHADQLTCCLIARAVSTANTTARFVFFRSDEPNYSIFISSEKESRKAFASLLRLFSERLTVPLSILW